MIQLKDMDEPHLQKFLQMLSEAVEGLMPGGSGPNGRALFCIMLFDGGIGQYVTNAERSDVVKAMRHIAGTIEEHQTVERVEFGDSTQPTPTIKLLCDRLNTLMVIDHVSMTALMLARSPIAEGSGWVDDPDVIVQGPDDLPPGSGPVPAIAEGGMTISVLGLLNGLHGCQTHDIAMILDKDTNRLMGFRVLPRTKGQ